MINDSGLLSDAILIFFTITVGGAGLLYFRHCGNTLAEATAYGFMVMIMTLSWISQVLLMTGLTALYLPGLLLGAAFALRPWWVHRRQLVLLSKALIRFARSHQVAVTGLLLAWGYMAIDSSWFAIPVSTGPDMSYYFPLWEHADVIFSNWRTVPHLALPTFNHAVFSAFWQPMLTPVLVNLGAYTAIGFGTYALARRYAWPSTAVTVTLLVISMHRVAEQSMIVHSELLPAAAALTAILALYRINEQPHGRDLIMLACVIAFSVSDGPLCYLLPAVLCALSVVVLGRRHGILLWGRNLGRRLPAMTLTLAIVVVFSQFLPVTVNLLSGSRWVGEPPHAAVVFNADALSGMLGNLARYMFLSIDLPQFVDQLINWMFGVSLLDALKSLYLCTVDAFLGGRGIDTAFTLNWAAGRGLCWFGPAGFLLVLPSVAAALARGPRPLKYTALAMVVYWVLICLIAAWRPENVAWMTSFFVCSGFIMAFLLPLLRFGRNGRLVLQLIGILLWGYAVLP